MKESVPRRICPCNTNTKLLSRRLLACKPKSHYQTVDNFKEQQILYMKS
jgi:hypothetical protein